MVPTMEVTRMTGWKGVREVSFVSSRGKEGRKERRTKYGPDPEPHAPNARRTALVLVLSCSVGRSIGSSSVVLCATEEMRENLVGDGGESRSHS
jgi:hypothetical protein